MTKTFPYFPQSCETGHPFFSNQTGAPRKERDGTCNGGLGTQIPARGVGGFHPFSPSKFEIVKIGLSPAGLRSALPGSPGAMQKLKKRN